MQWLFINCGSQDPDHTSLIKTNPNQTGTGFQDHKISKMFNISLLLFLLFAVANAVDVLELQADNFELILNGYKYIAVLFYDNSETGQNYKNAWLSAALRIHTLPPDCEISQVKIFNHMVF